jgi:5-methylcytosine-specific restriction endonuclease McrA
VAQQVLVLNATFEPLNVTSIWRACSLLLSGKAEVIEAHPERRIRSVSATFPYPVVIRLIAFVRVPRFTARKMTRRAVFARDDHRCQYCGTTTRLTVDHVVPRSRGGASVWENITTACAPCNLRKGNRLPHEASMSLTSQPKAPSPSLFLTLAAPAQPEVWTTYLAAFR